MLPPSYLDAMPDAFVQLAQQVEDEILQDVARRIGKMGTLTETANWQLWRYQQTEAVRENVVKLLAKYSGKSESTIRRLLKEAATEAMEREDAIYYHYNLEPTPFEESAALNNLLTAGARQTCGTWQNLTATTANTVSGAFERTLDVAWGKVSTGAFDYKTAVKQAVDSLADDMPEITYPSGHTDTLEVAARRAVLTGVNQTAGKLQEARMDEMNVEFVETSAHGGARPSHAEWQGRRFHRGGAVDYLGKHYPDFEQATGGRVDSARTSVPKFGRSEASKSSWAAREKSQGGSGALLQKLNYSDNVPQPERESIEKELSVLPQWQRDKAEGIISKVVMTEKDAGGSGYYYPTKTLYLHPERAAGDVIHEYGHALEISLKLIHNKEYTDVRRSGLDLSDLSKIVMDSETFTRPVDYLLSDKFVSTYQGRLYRTEDFGIFKEGTLEVDDSLLKDYFSEGYRAFYQEPSILKEKDPLLYHFIEGLKDDQK